MFNVGDRVKNINPNWVGYSRFGTIASVIDYPGRPYYAIFYDDIVYAIGSPGHAHHANYLELIKPGQKDNTPLPLPG